MLEPPAYPPGTIRLLLESELVTAPTRRAMKARLARPTAPRVFDKAAFATLSAVCARLIPQHERDEPIPLAAAFDARLVDGPGDGWRYAAMPPDREMHLSGVTGIEQSATAMYGRGFVQLAGEEQDSVLRSVQGGKATGQVWAAMDAGRYFEELLAAVVDIFYAHPLALEEIGYAGLADAAGWRAIGLDERESHEPRALSSPVKSS